MSLESRSIMTSVRERDTDLLFIQLIETAPEFREWFCQQLLNNGTIEKFLSISHSVETGNGESDIEIGVQTDSEERVLLLVENKIDASLQKKQAERYHVRGEQYVERGICDRFVVGLIAPERYANSISQEKFGNIITYESIIKRFKLVSHDALPFVKEMFEQAITKQTSNHSGYASVTQKINQRIQERSDEFPDIEIYDQSNNLIKFRSNHIDHPDSVRYKVWIIGSSEGREAMVRLSISNDIPESEIDTLQKFIVENFEHLDGFEIRDHVTMDTVRTYVSTGRDEDPTNESYINEIVTTLQNLILFSHPKLIDAEL